MEILDQPNHPEERPPMPIGKVLLVNIGLMLGYMILSGVSSDPEAGIIADSFLVVAQVGLNLAAGLVLVFMKQSRHIGGALLICGFLMGLIGFGSCLGKLALFGR